MLEIPGVAAIARGALADCPFAVAPMFAVTALSVSVVVTGTVTVVDPAGTTIVGGTVAVALSDFRATEMPPVGAA
jgi:hypothetical protein